MRLSLWGLGILALGFAGTVLASGNLILFGFSGLLILVGLVLLIVAAFVRWLQSHGIFRPPKTYGGLVATQGGEIVRSNSERMIADYFYQHNVRYVYERDAISKRKHRRISRPDFYLPDYGIYVEYWGMLGAEDPNVRSRYERTMKWKTAQYYENDIKFISIYPKNLANLDWIFRAKFRDVAGYDLPTRTSNVAKSRYCSNCGTPIEPASTYCQNCGNRIAG
jgi:hypothetical protein